MKEVLDCSEEKEQKKSPRLSEAKTQFGGAPTHGNCKRPLVALR